MFQDLLNKKFRKKGYSLIELMIAVLFLGIIAVALSPPITNSMFLTFDNKNINSANNLAKTYLRDVQDSWKIQADYDMGILVNADSEYTNNGEYTININSQDLETDGDGNVILRRVNIVYQDNDGNTLCNLYFDYNRPGSVL